MLDIIIQDVKMKGFVCPDSKISGTWVKRFQVPGFIEGRYSIWPPVAFGHKPGDGSHDLVGYFLPDCPGHRPCRFNHEWLANPEGDGCTLERLQVLPEIFCTEMCHRPYRNPGALGQYSHTGFTLPEHAILATGALRG
jgi:hypothetical protein